MKRVVPQTCRLHPCPYYSTVLFGSVQRNGSAALLTVDAIHPLSKIKVWSGCNCPFEVDLVLHKCSLHYITLHPAKELPHQDIVSFWCLTIITSLKKTHPARAKTTSNYSSLLLFLSCFQAQRLLQNHPLLFSFLETCGSLAL